MCSGDRYQGESGQLLLEEDEEPALRPPPLCFGWNIERAKGGVIVEGPERSETVEPEGT